MTASAPRELSPHPPFPNMIRPASETDAAITLRNVEKRFGNTRAVAGLDLVVPRGSLCGFLGPNGAGKSTTIRMIMSIIYPDSGSVRVLDDTALANKDRIGYLPEERGLYRTMKVGEFLIYLGKLKGLSGAAAHRNAGEWLERIDLRGIAKKKCQELSKGMQQKVQFIASVIHEPDLLILDEPFSGLDPVNVETLLEVIAELKKKGKTIIFSTHLMETAERLCDDIILINKSRKVLGGKLREVKESFGKNLIALRCSGGEKILEDKSLIEKVTEHADEKELVLAPNADTQILLKKLIENGAVISKFEQIEPSLNDIFIEQVKEKNDKTNS